MSRLTLLVIVVAVVALTAGCSGLSVGSSESGPDRDTYGVDEPLDPPSSDPDELLPGLSPEGLENADELWVHHQEVLETRSYTIDVESRAADEDDADALTTTQRIEYDPEADERFWAETRNGTQWWNDRESAGDAPVAVENWIDRDVHLVQTEYENGSVEYRDGGLGGIAVTGVQLRSILGAGTEFEVYSHEAGDERYYVLQSTEPSSDQFLAEEPFAAEVYVHEDGYIAEGYLVGKTPIDDETVVIEERVVIDDGEVSLEEPDWTEEALEELAETGDEAVSQSSSEG